MDENFPEWYRIIWRVLREFECYDHDVWDSAGGLAAYFQLRQAALREKAAEQNAQLTGNGLVQTDVVFCPCPCGH